MCITRLTITYINTNKQPQRDLLYKKYLLFAKQTALLRYTGIGSNRNLFVIKLTNYNSNVKSFLPICLLYWDNLQTSK